MDLERDAPLIGSSAQRHRDGPSAFRFPRVLPAFARLLAPWVAVLGLETRAYAQTGRLIADLRPDLEVYGVALSSGLALFSAFLALAYIAERKSWLRRESELTAKLEVTRAQRDRAEIFLSAEQQLFIAWDGPSGEPDIEGSSQLVGESSSPRRVLAFGAWLTPTDAQELEQKIDRLRRSGEAFQLAVVGLSGRHYDVDGRAVGGRAVLRLREVSGDRLELIGLRERFAHSNVFIDGLRGLLEALPSPVWLRDDEGRLVFVNSAYAQAVEAKDPTDAIERQVELLDKPARSAAAKAKESSLPWRDQVHAVVAGGRHLLDVIQTPFAQWAATIAIDRQEIESMRADFQKQMDSHARTLDQLQSAVAIFDGAQQLIYRNAAYEKLWRLDTAFLAGRPSDAEILDRLRLEQRLPVEGDFRAWKARLLEAYRSPEQLHHTWHMPDGRTICVTITPNPKGGVTYLYDDMSERYDLQSRFNALYRMQNETLETLREGVAVFGADGRLKFSNPAFAALWRVARDTLAQKPHFEKIAELCKELHANDETWNDLRGVVTGLADMRQGFTRRLERSDGMVLDLSAQPLPEGASLLTFVDVTADVNVERALTDRNKALLAAEKLRNDFIHHVSYELRSPLTNINGFVHLLSDESTGALNARQLEYLGYVRKSSDALLAIVDDILDLATMDEDALELDLEDVDARAAMHAAIEGVQDRLAENKIELQIVAPDDIGTFRGDAKRVRQILFNLLSNAIGFSRPGQTVTLAAMRRQGDVVFKVVDRGRGIPPDLLDRVFDRFESHTAGSRHRGVGLGLSIVKVFMDLHGGKILIQSALGEGTAVSCVFPGQTPDAADESAPHRAPEKIEASRLMDEVAVEVREALEKKSVKLRLLPTSKLACVLCEEGEAREALVDLLKEAIDCVGAGQAVNLAGIQREDEIAFKLSYRGKASVGESETRDRARKLIEASGGKMLTDEVAGEGVTITCIFPSVAPDADLLSKGDA
jgi:signal transduction histidine kinase